MTEGTETMEMTGNNALKLIDEHESKVEID